MTHQRDRRDLERDRVTEANKLFRMAYALQLEGDIERAWGIYEKSLRLHPTAEAHTYLGWAKSTRGQVEEAIAHCRKAILLKPDFPNPWNDIGAYLVDLGRPEDALFFLKRAARMKSHPSLCFPHYNLHRAYLAMGDRARATTHLQAALDVDPEFTPASEALAELLRPALSSRGIAPHVEMRSDARAVPTVLSFRPKR